jgi:Mn-dependent DtxR family transcriptional regulator
MLKDLLTIIEQESIYNPYELAKRLDTTPELVEQMLAHLVRAGRLKTVSTCQSNLCKGCSLSSSCSTNKPRIWSLNR